MSSQINRRAALGGAAGLATGLAAAACGGQDDTETTSTPDVPTGEKLVDASEVPVGGGVILKDQKVVVTQPEKGDFKAFSSVCTHQGCPVTKVAETIDCSCHGSKFSISDGSVSAGPAEKSLPTVAIKVAGGAITTT